MFDESTLGAEVEVEASSANDSGKLGNIRR